MMLAEQTHTFNFISSDSLLSFFFEICNDSESLGRLRSSDDSQKSLKRT